MEGRDVAVVGAGIVGVSCAIHLLRAGHRVTLVDRLPPGEATSAGNAGVLAAASMIPAAAPGVLRQVPRWLLHPDGPLAIRPAYLPRLLPWLLRFVRAGRADRIRPRAAALNALRGTTVDDHLSLARSAGCAELIRREGYLFVYFGEAGFAKDALGMAIRAELGVPVQVLRGAAIRDLEPSLSPEVAVAAYMPENGHAVDPKRLTQALAAHFAASGGTVRQAEVRDIRIENGIAAALESDAGAIPFDALVVAAGAWSGRLARRLGSRVPLESERGYHVTIRDAGVAPRMPVAAGEGKFVATAMQPGLRLAGTAEFAGLTAPPNWNRARVLLRQGTRLFPGLDTRDHTEWMGHRPSLPDSLPVIGPSPRHRNVFYAFGHSHTGLTDAPITGRLIADLVSGRQPQLDIRPYRVDRF